jgi:hypothetical protein
MSVNWSAKIGYGFAVDISGIEAVLGEYDDLCQDFDYTLSKRYPLLDTEYAGNSFSGEGAERFVFIKSSIVNARDWSQTFDLNKLSSSLNSEAIESLWKFVNETGVSTGAMDWHVLINCG